MNQRIAVIMAGGSGERFWPVSTKLRPKQFLKLADPQKTLIEQSVDRATGIMGADKTYIATARHLAELSNQNCPTLPPKNILAEPTKRNTTGALAWVAACLIAEYPENWATTTVAVLTADHRITTQSQFQTTVNRAMTAAEEQGAIVTIGIRPDRPETGFGYIDCGEQSGEVKRVNKFTEKPDLQTAEKFLASGNFLWNSGMFFYTLPTFMSEMERHQPEIAATIRKMAGELAQGQFDQADTTFESLASISIDYALLEKSDKILVAEADFQWDDLGAWDSISRSYEPDDQCNVSLGETNLIESQNNVIYNETTTHTVNILGIEDLAVVVTNDQILIIPKNRAQDVKKFLNP
jgi:mannose-1-phosphate guanylyltransferase